MHQPEADGETGAEGAIDARIIIDGVPLITGHVDQFRIGRLDLNRAGVVDDIFLGGAGQIVPGLRQETEALDGSHDVLLLIEKRLAELGGPGEIVIEPLQHGGIMGQCLDTGVPRLRGDLARVPAAVDIAVRHDNLRGHRRGGEYFGEQRVGIERDGLEQLVQRVG